MSINIDCIGITWAHNGRSGATHWVYLCSGYSACGGQRQSPLKITGAENNNTLSANTCMPKSVILNIVTFKEGTLFQDGFNQ